MTQPPTHLADELRRIADAPVDIPPAYRDRLRMLAAEVAAMPATAELEAIHAGLEPEQEIRARAIELAGDLLELPPRATAEAAVQTLVKLAEPIAAWIRNGAPPEAEPRYVEEGP